MGQWNFYFSGILYGKIQENERGLLVQKWLSENGSWSEWLAFDEQEDASFVGLCKRSILKFFRHREEYEAMLPEHPETFTTKSGEIFARRQDTSYYQRNQSFPMDLFYDQNGIYSVVMCGRDYTAILVKKGMEQKTILRDWEVLYPGETRKDGEYQPGPVYTVACRGTFWVPTRDGERLATDVYVPVGSEHTTFPTVLVRTPYGRGIGKEGYYRFVQRGYAVVIQDTRGREDSTGEWLPEYYEIEDGDDTLNWIAAQEFSDGQVGMTGGSYLGYVQWAAAASGNPHLKAMLSSVCAGSAFVDIPRRGGCFTSGMLAWAFAMSEQRMRGDLMAQEHWDEILDVRPLEDIPKKALGHEIAFLNRWLSHMDMDDFWQHGNWSERYQGKPVPALILSGWFDDNGMGTTEALDLVKDWPKGTWKAILGPWKHSGNVDYDLHGFRLGENALRYDMDLQCMMWLEHFLKGVENGIERTATVEYYTMGENRWKEAQSWPGEQTSEVFCFLDGTQKDGAAGNGTECGTGSLSFVLPKQPGKDTYEYDPDHPAIHIVDVSDNELEVPADYAEEEKRADILSYSTLVREEPVTITGDVKVRLFVSCDCPDTDFVVRITDVDEEDHSFKLADGVLSAKYRNGFETPEFMRPGEIYEITVRTTKLSHTFLPGHRLRLTITSSAKNFIFPNSNTEKGFDSKERQKAHIIIYRGGNCASGVSLPVEH